MLHRMYVICAESLLAGLQPGVVAGPQADAQGAEAGQPVRPWVVEWGVMGYGNMFARMRMSLKEDGQVDRWTLVTFSNAGQA